MHSGILFADSSFEINLAPAAFLEFKTIHFDLYYALPHAHIITHRIVSMLTQIPLFPNKLTLLPSYLTIEPMTQQ